MQVSSIKPTPVPQYNPFILQFNVQTVSDAEKLRFIFAYEPLISALGMPITAASVREEIDKHSPIIRLCSNDFASQLRRNITQSTGL